MCSTQQIPPLLTTFHVVAIADFSYLDGDDIFLSHLRERVLEELFVHVRLQLERKIAIYSKVLTKTFRHLRPHSYDLKAIFQEL